MDRSRAGFLHARDNKIDLVDLAPAQKICLGRFHFKTVTRFSPNTKADRRLASSDDSAVIHDVEETTSDKSEGFEDLAWLFTCDSRNRGLIRQGFDEAALLWKAVKASSGNILEIGRNLAGSTVLLAAAADEARVIYSIDNRSNEHRACKNYLAQLPNNERVRLLVADSRMPLANGRFGMLFIDGDHTFEGVLADVVAHWNALESVDNKPALAAFHDALPNDNFKWRDADRRLNRVWTRLKNKFRKRQKAEVAPDYSPGVKRVCDELVRQGAAMRWSSTGSMLVLQKMADLPPNFAQLSETRV